MSNLLIHNCDVLVVGAGPAGISAAVTAAEHGSSVLLVDDNATPGGQIWRNQIGANKKQHDRHAARWISRLNASRVLFLPHTRFAVPVRDGEAICEQNTKSIRINYQSIILATGARELFLPFSGWTLPNVMGAGGLQAMVKSGLPIAGKRVVVAGSGPLLLAVASTLRQHGAVIDGVFEQASLKSLCSFGISLLPKPRTILDALRYGLRAGITKYHTGWWPIEAEGDSKLESVILTNGIRQRRIDCNYLACGFHLIPNIELAQLMGCDIQNGHVVVDFMQRTSVKNVYCAGETTGIGGLDASLLEGEIAGLRATGSEQKADNLLSKNRRYQAGAIRMNTTFAPRSELKKIANDSTIVCRCEDVRWEAIRPFHSSRSAKLYTRCGMGPCQGRICGPSLKFIKGWDYENLRPPLYPVLVSTLLPPAALNKETV